MILSAHQPNFCPYAGIFEKIAQSDVFVLLNHVQFTKNNFQNRFMYKAKWYTMRVNQKHEPIIDKEYLHPTEDWGRITRELPKLKIFDGCVDNNLSQMNYMIIAKACWVILGISKPLAVDGDVKLSGTDRLIDLCIKHNCDTYLSGTSGKNYLDLSLFDKAGIKVIFQQNPDKRALVELL